MIPEDLASHLQERLIEIADQLRPLIYTEEGLDRNPTDDEVLWFLKVDLVDILGRADVSVAPERDWGDDIPF